MISESMMNDMLFFDIETTSKEENYTDMSEMFQSEWEHRCDTRYKDLLELGWDYNRIFHERAPLNLDFAKIVCISIGSYVNEKKVTKSITGDTEKEILIKFSEGLKKIQKECLAGANILDYDLPLLCRAYLRNGLQIPYKILAIINSKPWEREKIVFDICEKWAFGSYGNKYNRFNLICISLGVDSPKSDIDGTQVTRIYWEDNDIDRISAYCERDVIAVIDCALAIKNIYSGAN